MGGIGICCCTVSKARIRNGHGKLVIEPGDQVMVLQCRNVAPLRVWVGKTWLSHNNIDIVHHQLKWVKVFSQVLRSQKSQKRFDQQQRHQDEEAEKRNYLNKRRACGEGIHVNY